MPNQIDDNSQQTFSEVPQKQLSLDADQVMMLTDRVLNRDTDEIMNDSISIHTLLLKLGSAYVEMLCDHPSGASKKLGEVAISLSEPELWLLRSKVASGDKTASDPLCGVKLLGKIYRLLLEYNVEYNIPAGDEHGESFSEEKKTKLREFLKDKDDSEN